jgi:broad specificity phosphatase PhoE
VNQHNPAKPDGATPTGAARTVLALARHGETVWHADNRYAGGGSDIDLTPRGRRQSRALADWCRERRPNAVVSSPVRRARETALPAADAIGVDLVIVEELREVDFGLAEGRTIDELARIDSDMVTRFRADPHANPFPGAEQPEEAALRAATALRAITAHSPGGRVLVVAHNTILRLAMCLLLDIPLARYRNVFPRLENGAISEIAMPIAADGIPALLSLNVGLTLP